MTIRKLREYAGGQYLVGVLASILVMLVWSGWVVLSRAGMTGAFSAWDLGFLRFGTAALIGLPILFWRRIPIRRIFAPEVMLAAFFGGTAYTLLSFAALAQSPATNAGVVVNGLIPLATLALLALFTFRRPRPVELAVSLLVLLANFILLGGTLIPVGAFLMFVGAAFSLAIYMVVVTIWKLDTQLFLSAAPIINAIITIPCWLLFDGHLSAPWQDIALQALYQGVLVTIIAITLMTFAIHKVGSLTVSMIMSAVPLMTALLAYFLLGEPITLLHLIALALCSAGILLHALLSRPKQQKGRAVAENQA